MSDEEYVVGLVNSNGDEIDGVFHLNPDDEGDDCRLELRSRFGNFSAVVPDYFEAMCMIRTQLATLGCYPRCYGSSRNVYPSGMCRKLGQFRTGTNVAHSG